MKSNEKVFSFENAGDSPGFLLWQVTNLWQREIKKALEKFRLTHSQFVLLASAFWLSQHQEDVMQVNLSAHTKIDPMTTSKVLRTLQTKGLLKRQEHHTDYFLHSLAARQRTLKAIFADGLAALKQICNQ